MQWADLTDAGLQGANLENAGLQWADLTDAGLQGTVLVNAGLQWADLINAELQGADLTGTGLQGANLEEVDLEGAFSSLKPDQFGSFGTFEERINKRRGKDTELTGTVFTDGISLDEFNRIEQNLTKSGMEICENKQGNACIRPHLKKKQVFNFLKNFIAMRGILTDATADQIIKEYKEAMQLVL